MKRRRIIRKLLSVKFIIIYLLLITIGIFVCLFTIDKLKATPNESSSQNIAFVKSDFQNMSNNVYEDAYENTPGSWCAQNDKYVMYFNEKTTIFTVYTIEAAALDGSNETHDGVSYPKVDITKCTKYYRSAQGTKDEKAANIIARYANASSGKVIASVINSMTHSAQYLNTLTENNEQHYYMNKVDNGLQIIYHIGNFSAGADYLPTRFYATLYRPDPACYSGGANSEAYKKACDIWVSYMAIMGISDAEQYLYKEDADDLVDSINKDSFKNNGYQDILRALNRTFEERMRGNCYIIMSNGNVTGTSGDKYQFYSGTMNVYTREAYEWLKAKLREDYPDEMYEGKTIQIPEADEVKTDVNTVCAYWIFRNLPLEIFTDRFNEYFNNIENTPLTANPFLLGDVYSKTVFSEKVYTYSDASESFDYKSYVLSKTINGATLRYAYNALYGENQYIGAGGTKYYADKNATEPWIVGGYCERDENGDFVHDDAGDCVRRIYTLEQASTDNAFVGVESASSLPIFQIGVQFVLTEDGLQVSIMSDTLVDCSNASSDDLEIYNGVTIKDRNDMYYLYNVDVLPYMTYVDNSKVVDPADRETGMIVVPDGSGAIINFDNGKVDMNATAVNTSYYGNDLAFTSKEASESTLDLMLGMYGYIYTTPTNRRAILAVIEKGGNQVSLYAHTIRGISQAYFTGLLRANEIVKIGAYASKNQFTKWAKAMTESDLQFVYMFLEDDEANYVSMANRYREYLIKRDNLEVKDNTTNTVVDLNFLGAFEEYALFLGFKYKRPAALTTFLQAKEIIEELSNGIDVKEGDATVKKNVSSFNASFTAWTSEEMEYEAGGKIKVASVLGGVKSMRELASYLSSIGSDFYAETYVTSTKDYDYSYGNLKYSARSVANETARIYQFNTATLRQDRKLSSTFVLKPSYYLAVAREMNNKVEKLNISSDNLGYYLVDLGNLSVGNYSSGDEIYGQAALKYQTDVLEMLSKDHKLKIKAAYDYAFKYADFITEVPLTSTARAIYDETIPFYQLVISGLIDYSTEEINGTSNQSADWFYTKAVETGSNLSFVISASNPTVLLDTDYTYYYQAYYQNWKEIIARFAYDIDQLGINKGRLVFHENVAKNIAHVKYDCNSTIIELYINNTGLDYVLDPDVTIKSYSVYKKVS